MTLRWSSSMDILEKQRLECPKMRLRMQMKQAQSSSESWRHARSDSLHLDCFLCTRSSN